MHACRIWQTRCSRRPAATPGSGNQAGSVLIDCHLPVVEILETQSSAVERRTLRALCTSDWDCVARELTWLAALWKDGPPARVVLCVQFEPVGVAS